MTPSQNKDTLPGVIFTDLDGTLLSPETYQPGPSREALEICKNRQIPVVFVSSKTRAEIEVIRRDLNPDDPFISENGGGIYLPQEMWRKPHAYLPHSQQYQCS